MTLLYLSIVYFIYLIYLVYLVHLIYLIYLIYLICLIYFPIPKVQILADKSADAINLKISKVGGLTKARAIRDLAVASGIPMNIEGDDRK